MPFAGYKDFAACLAANKDKSDPKAYCATIMRKAEGEMLDRTTGKATIPSSLSADKPRKRTRAENLNFEYLVPILKETDSAGKKMTITGVAINSTVTRNNVRYTEEELKKSCESLIGRPLLTDHKQEVRNIVGRITDAKFNAGKIEYTAEVMDDQIRGMIEDGRITNVSIGARVKELLEEEATEEGAEPVKRPVGLEFLELSFVAVPGDPNATVDNALSESFKKATKVVEMAEDTLKKKDFGGTTEADDAPVGGSPAGPAGGVEQKLDQLLQMMAQLLQMEQGESQQAGMPREDMAQAGIAAGTPPQGQMAKKDEGKTGEEAARVKALEEQVRKLTEAALKGKALVTSEGVEEDAFVNTGRFVMEHNRDGAVLFRVPNYDIWRRK